MKLFENYFLINEIINEALIEYYKDRGVVWVSSIEKLGSLTLNITAETNTGSFTEMLIYDDRVKSCFKEVIAKKINDTDSPSNPYFYELLADYLKYLSED